MAQLITMTLDDDGGDGAAAVFEVDDALVGPGPPPFEEGVAVRGRMSLQEALDQLEPALTKVSQSVRRLGPHEMEIEFGLKMGGETGVVVAKGTAEVNFAVRLVWRRH
ncbi:CU044_2847 family protein [Streptomyces sp. TRM64462]|uniref:CU044_2847 family protein n=1 Tax=Streptomyces sp. TRM64462 TaxID=2741726 RepID=UPI001585E8AC|nr:CU044_2847 family protein [Streptomyces sp. TRM64462]